MRTCALRSQVLHGLEHLEASPRSPPGSRCCSSCPHGSTKSALLNRVAAALGLEHLHYNASLVSFEALLGFPLPNEARTELQYLRTPATLWGRGVGLPLPDLALPPRRCRTSSSRSCTSGA